MGPLYKQLEHHYDTPELWVAAMAEHRAVLKAIAAHDAAARARRDAAASRTRRTSDSATGLGRAAMTPRDRPEQGTIMLACRIHAKEDLRIEAGDRRRPAPARCCCGSAPAASAAPTSITTSRAATAASSCASR